jgi:hypothetical protein
VNRSTQEVLLRKFKGNTLFERYRHLGNDNVKMDFKEMGWEDVDWIHLAQNKV